MALIVTPGASDADSYATLASAAAYHAALGHSEWTGDDAVLEAALRRGTLWVDWKYGAQFPGFKKNGRSQPLEWPRTDVTDRNGYSVSSDEIPIEVQKAAMEAALRELSSPNSLMPDYVYSGAVKREKLEGAVEIEYVDSSGPSSVQPYLAVVDGILASLLSAGSGSSLRPILRS